MAKPIFQKRHYKRIVELLKETYTFPRKIYRWSLAGEYLLQNMIKMFEKDNPRFNRAKFLEELCKTGK